MKKSFVLHMEDFERILPNIICICLLLALIACGSTMGSTAKKTGGSVVSNKKLGKKGNITLYHITYYSDGLKVKGILYLPPVKKGQKFPVVIFNHDGISGISLEHEKSSLRIAGEGYAVFCPAYRGESTSYRDRKKKEDERDKSQGEIEIAKGEVNDVLNAIKMLSHYKWADMNRVALVGASHGALISVIAAARSKQVKALVAAYGVMDIYKWWDFLKKNNKVGKDEITRRTYGDGPEDQPKSFAIRNGLSYVKKIKCPVLILQGSKDDIVPDEQARFMEEALKKNGKKYETYIYPDCLHGFLVYAPYLDDVEKEEKEQTEEAWQVMLKFLNETLSNSKGS